MLAPATWLFCAMSAMVERAASDASAPAAEVVCCVGTEQCARHLTLVALHVICTPSPLHASTRTCAWAAPRVADTSSRLRARSGPFRSIKQALLQCAKDDADEATYATAITTTFGELERAPCSARVAMPCAGRAREITGAHAGRHPQVLLPAADHVGCRLQVRSFWQSPRVVNLGCIPTTSSTRPASVGRRGPWAKMVAAKVSSQSSSRTCGTPERSSTIRWSPTRHHPGGMGWQRSWTSC